MAGGWQLRTIRRPGFIAVRANNIGKLHPVCDVERANPQNGEPEGFADRSRRLSSAIPPVICARDQCNPGGVPEGLPARQPFRLAPLLGVRGNFGGACPEVPLAVVTSGHYLATLSGCVEDGERADVGM